ncbi:MAG: cobalamin B12-binding domain-containing protein [Pseudomonadota bacterium]
MIDAELINAAEPITDAELIIVGQPTTENGADREFASLTCTEQIEAVLSVILHGDKRDLARAETWFASLPIPFSAVCKTIVEPVALKLGELWAEDKVSFIDVTVASGRLKGLVSVYRGGAELSPSNGFGGNGLSGNGLAPRKVLLARAVGEQHTLGLLIVGIAFENAGWEVVGGDELCNEPAILDRLSQERFDLMGLSVGTQSNATHLAGAGLRFRNASLNPDLKICIGGPAIANTSHLCQSMAADFSATDALDAVQQAERLLA